MPSLTSTSCSLLLLFILSSIQFSSASNTTEVKCGLCSRLNKDLESDVIPSSTKYPGQTCQQIQNQISFLDIHSTKCQYHIDYFEQRCCDQSASLEFYECASNIRSTLLSTNLYDPTIPPVHGVNGTMRVLEVEALLGFMSVKDLNVLSSTLEIFVGLELTWNDPRLKWDVDDNHCATKLYMRADSTLEETEIWVPSLDLLNMASGTQNMPSRLAVVQNDGTVRWSRLGSLTAICTFTGLGRMPFDNLGCRLNFGDYGTYPYLIDYKLKEIKDNSSPDGLVFWDHEINYAEFNVVKKRSESGYDSNQRFYYHFYFHRAMFHYIVFAMLPNVFFTYMSFGQFALDESSGERIQFSITAVLITVAHGIVVAGFLPITNEVIWLNIFNFVSMLFTWLGIIETIIICWLYSKSKKDQVHDDSNLSVDEENCDELQEDKSNLSIDDETDEVVKILSSSVIKQQDLGDMTNNVEDRQRWKKFNPGKIFAKLPKNWNELILMIDFLCIISLPTLYTLFIIVMIATNHYW